MNADQNMALVRALCHEAHLALWAALTAFLVYFAVFVAPKLPTLHAAAEQRRLHDIAAENEAYCAKWGMGPATAMHNECVADLQQLRAEIEDRFAEEFDF